MRNLLVLALFAGLFLAACSRADSEPPVATALPSPQLQAKPVFVDPAFEDKGPLLAVHFDTDMSTLSAEAQNILQRQTAWLQQYPQSTLTIEGHADERGTREYNLALGERRAQAVMAYLIALGVDPKRLKTISYGKERPVCTEANDACWSQNRRTVTVVDN